VDYRGQPVTLGDYFDGQRPVVLTLNYSDCPMLCSLQLDGLFDGLKKMSWDMGDKFQMVSASIDPSEPPERASMTRDKYLKMYGRPGCGGGLTFLVGENPSIKALADAVGFHYRFVPETGEYAHTAVTIICTPDGRISRYLYGVQYDQQTLRLSLLEAAQGKIGSPMEQLFLFCFQYDSEAGRYGPAAWTLMKIAGVFTVLFVGGLLLVYWKKEKARRLENSELVLSS
jgi:protein SCO1/2